jgi:fibronectin type 3 domain-containing protein
MVDETLPIVKLTKMGTIVDMKTIALEWRPIEDTRVRGVYIYKAKLSSDGKGSDGYYQTVNSRYGTHFVDNDVEPESSYSYYFITYSKNAQSLPSKATIVTTLPIMKSVSWIHSIQGMPRSAKILWRPHSNKRVKAYVIQRRTLETDVWNNLKVINGRLNVEYIDYDLKDKFTYKYRIRCLTYDNITSKPSAVVTVITKALPIAVQNITATTNLPKKILIKWDKYKSDDFSHYNLYRSKDIDSGYKIIKKLRDNQYENMIKEDSVRFFYQVSVVDKDGLESMHQENSAQGKSLQKPLAPAVVEAKLVNGTVEIYWNKPDERAVGYIVEKTYKKNLFNSINEEFEGVMSPEFIDKEIYAGATYSYIIYSIDKDGIRSEPSIEINLQTSKSNKTLLQGTPEKKVVKDFEQKVKKETFQKVRKKTFREVKKEPVQKVRRAVNKDVVIISNDFN